MGHNYIFRTPSLVPYNHMKGMTFMVFAQKQNKVLEVIGSSQIMTSSWKCIYVITQNVYF